ncbi:MAG: hypothetical protein AAF694_17780 [Bacteroidota bacterium]
MGIRHFISITLLLLAAGCEPPPANDSLIDIPLPDDLTFLTSNGNSFPVAICLWREVSVYGDPGFVKDAEIISSVALGDQVFMLGPTKRLSSGKQSYMKVRLADGSEGWVSTYHFGREGKSAVITQATPLHRRPDPRMVKKELLQPGDFVVVVDEKEGWVKVMGKEKTHVGWVQREPGLSELQEDVRIAVLYERARSETELSRKISLLESILEEAQEGSSFLDMIEADLLESSKQMENKPGLPESDPSQITAIK